MDVPVVGESGLVGWNLVDAFQEATHTVVGT